jgi:uncharacterized glyoxalase superfamily protein PhnB
VFTSMFSILSTRDLPRLLDFYVTALDAKVAYQFPDDGDAVFVSVDVAGSHLGLGADQQAGEVDAAQRAALWLYADSCDEAVDRLVAHGATVLTAPEDMPWGERVADVRDPDGNLLHIGQQLGQGSGAGPAG